MPNSMTDQPGKGTATAAPLALGQAFAAPAGPVQPAFRVVQELAPPVL